jgi:DNA repair protein RadD
LTATPIRLDGKGLGEIYSEIVSVIPMADLIADGHLVKPRVFAPFTPDMRGVKKTKGDYDATQTACLMDKKEITADIVKHWLSAARVQGIDFIELVPSTSSPNPPKDYRKTIIFASSVQHSKNIVEEFTDNGISAKHLDATTPAAERDSVLQAWRDGEFTVLSNCGLFIEGLDVPDASCCILARPTKSLTIYLQAVGRVMRPHESKTDCIILDCAGLTYEHGFVDDAREWTLDGKVKKTKDEVPAVHICPECFAAYSKAQHPHECPECGFKTPVEQREVNNADVNMVELTQSMVDEIRKQNKIRDLKMCKTLDDYKAMAKRRYNYKIGWAYIKWERPRKVA